MTISVLLSAVRKWHSVSNTGRNKLSVSVTSSIVTVAKNTLWLLQSIRYRLREALKRSAPKHRQVFMKTRLEGSSHLWSDSLSKIHQTVFIGRLLSSRSANDDDKHVWVPQQINQQIISVADSFLSKNVSSEESTVLVHDELQSLLLRHQHEVNAVNMSTMIHRIGAIAERTGRDPTATHPFLIERVLSILDAYRSALRPRNVSNVLLGLGKIRLQMKTPSFRGFDAVVENLMQMAVAYSTRFKSQEVSNLLTGLAYLQETTRQSQIRTLLENALSEIDNFNPQEVSNTVWAVTKLECVGVPEFYRIALSRVQMCINEYAPMHIAMILWAMAKIQLVESEELVDNLITALYHAPIDTRTVAIVLWSARQLNFLPEESVLDRLLDKSGCLNPQIHSAPKARDCVMILAVLADFGHRSLLMTTFCRAVKNQFRERCSVFSTHDVCSLLWAMAMMDDEDLNIDFLRHSFGCLDVRGPKKINNQGIRQFYQSLLHLKFFRKESDASSFLLPSVELRWKAVWSVRQETSPLPLWVAAAMEEWEGMGYSCRGRFLEKGLINTAVIDVLDGFKYAIEGITFMRCYSRPPYRPTARYLWKIRLLEAMGYTVIRIEQRKWWSLTKAGSRRSYLMEQIRQSQLNRGRSRK